MQDCDKELPSVSKKAVRRRRDDNEELTIVLLVHIKNIVRITPCREYHLTSLTPILNLISTLSTSGNLCCFLSKTKTPHPSRKS